MNICVMGTSVSSGNRGVLALGASLTSLCLQTVPNAELKLLLGHNKADTFFVKVGAKEYAIPVVHCRLSPRSKLQDHLAWILCLSILFRFLPPLRPSILRANKWIRTIAEADMIGDVRGGDSFSDIYGLKGFLLGFIVVWTVLLVKREIVQFPQTYGPYKSPLARRLARYLLQNSSTVIARDKQSQALAQEILGKNKTVLLSPDVAFSLEAVRPREIILDPPLKGPTDSRIIGLNVSGLIYNGGYTRNNMFGLKLEYPSFLRLLVVAILKKTDGELWLVPHTFEPSKSVESDPNASSRLRDSLPQELQSRVRIVAAAYDQHEIKGIIGMCDFFIGSRMHSCIAALSQGIPCVGIAYSMKFDGVFESVGVRDWVVDGRKLSNEEAVTRVLDLYDQRDQVRNRLTRHANAARVQLNEVFGRLLTAGADQK